MVRSKGEGLPGRELLHLVEQIRAEDKYFNVSLAELARKLERERYCETRWEHETADEDGSLVSTELRLNLAARRGNRWAVSLKLHRIRIDGIDWLRAYDAPDGSPASGWHRHGWDPNERAARLHVPLPNFGDDLRDVDDFLIRICRELHISLSASDVGYDDDLPFD